MVQRTPDRRQRGSGLYMGIFILAIMLLFGITTWILSSKLAKMSEQDENIAIIDFSGELVILDR